MILYITYEKYLLPMILVFKQKLECIKNNYNSAKKSLILNTFISLWVFV